MHGDKNGATAKLQEVAQRHLQGNRRQSGLALLEAWKGIRSVRYLSSGCPLRASAQFHVRHQLGRRLRRSRKDPAAIRIYQDLLRDLESKAQGSTGEIYFRIGKNYFEPARKQRGLEQFRLCNRARVTLKPSLWLIMKWLAFMKTADKELAKECYRQAVKSGGSLPLIEKEIEQARRRSGENQEKTGQFLTHRGRLTT
jgi:hypothetical protein